MLGKRIKEYLGANGIKQTYLTEETGLNADQVSRILNGAREISAVEYYEICKKLKLPMEFFLVGSEESDDNAF